MNEFLMRLNEWVCCLEMFLSEGILESPLIYSIHLQPQYAHTGFHICTVPLALVSSYYHLVDL